MSKTIPQLSTVPGGVTAANLFFEVARQITAGNFNGESEKISADALFALLAGTSLTVNIIQRLNPTGVAYNPATTYTLYDYLDVAYQDGHYAYINPAPSAGHLPTDSAYWLLISSDGADGADGASGLTQTQADARYPLKTDPDPYPTYLTQAEAAALFSPLGGDAQGGLRYALSLATTSPPSSGQVRFNNAAIASVTQIFIHESDRNSAAQSEILDAIALGTRLQVALESNEEIYAWFRVSGAVVDNGSDRAIPVAFISSAGVFAAEEVTLNFLQIQASASGGASGIKYTYSDTAGAGVISAADLTTATTLTINATDAQGKSATDVLNRIKNDTIFELRKDGANWVRYLATADFTSGSVAVTVQQFLGTIVTTDTVFLSLVSDAPSTGAGGSGSTLPITFGDGTATSFTITHNLGTRNVLFGIYKAASPYTEVSAPVERTTSNTLTINTAPYVPSAGEFIIVVSSGGSASGSSGRIRLSAPRTYYVRADGTRTGHLTSETDATTNTSGDAFGNLQTAILAIAALDCSVHTPTIQLQDGTYPYFYLVTTIGSKSPVISGNSGDINAVILQGFESRFIGNPWLIKNCKISQTALYYSVSVESSRILFGAINWGDTQGILVDAQKASTVVFTEGFTMSGSGSDRGFVAGGCSQIYLSDGSTVNRLNTPTFPGGFCKSLKIVLLEQ